MPDRLLTLINVSVSFGGLKAVSHFNLEINARELCGLIGPNGAGKTTVFNLITGVYKPTEGRIVLEGESLVELPPFDIVKRGIARTFQNIRLFGDLTVLENVLISYHMRLDYGPMDYLMRTQRFSNREASWASDAESLLSLLGLAGRKDQKAGSLPYGDQRRLEIARALATQPKLLLLDEPAAGLNSKEKTDLMQTISQIRKLYNVAILVIEHDMKLVMGICERIIVLDHGEIIAIGPPRVIQDDPKVIQAYLGVG